jgi:hypothetical protein
MKAGVSLQLLRNLYAKRLKFQRRVVKWPIRSFAALLLASFAGSCVPGERPEARPVPGWTGNESPAYRSGHADGSGDRREGRACQPDGRHPSPATRDHYVLGYTAGYRHPHDNPWSADRAYGLGGSRGREDRQAGRPPDPDRHSGDVPRAVRDHFRRGYGAGWNAT